MPGNWRGSLLWRYAASFGSVVGALLLAGAVVNGTFAWREALAAVAQLQQVRAEAAAQDIYGYVAQTERALRAALVKFGAAPMGDDLRVELTSILRHHPQISELRWLGPDGAAPVALRRFGLGPVAGAEAADEPQAALARQQGRSLGPVYFRLNSEPYATLAVGLGADGPALVAEVNLTHVRDLLNQTEAAGLAYLVDVQGRLLAHPDLDQVLRRTDWSGLPQVARMLGPTANGRGAMQFAYAGGDESQPVLATAARVGDLGWSVHVEQPRRQAMRPVTESLARSAVLLLVGLVLAGAASVALARHMVRPIRSLQQRAEHLAEGRFEGTEPVQGSGELAALAQQFDRMARHLSQVHADQERRIAERTAALAQADAAKTRFVAAASHDLRQPIHALSLFSQQLASTPLPPPAADLAAQVQRSTQALAELIDGLLDLSQLDTGILVARPQGLPLQPLLRGVAASFEPLAAEVGLQLRCRPTALWVTSDSVLLQRLLGNLLSNAIRATRRGGVLVAARRRGGEVEVLIADTGRGISAEHLPRVFDELYRVPGAGDPPGLGLGLAIVRRLADRLGHRVMLNSVSGRGTVARVRLALAQPGPAIAEAKPAEPPSLPADPLAGLRVLVVEDDAAVRTAMVSMLERWGCAVDSAADGAGALAAVHRQAPELLLCDLMLGEGDDGVDLLAKLGKGLPRLPACVWISAATDPALLARAGATGWPLVRKPALPARLRAAADQALRQRPA